jgi:hypothetical protein
MGTTRFILSRLIWNCAWPAILAAQTKQLPKGDGEVARPKPAAAVSSAPAPGQGYYRLKLVKVIDNEGFGPNIEVARLLIPSDWKSEGGVHWTSAPGCPSNIVKLEFKATSPDGLSGIEFAPSYAWQYVDDPSLLKIAEQQAAAKTQCQVGPVMGPIEYLRTRVIPHMRPGARVIESEMLPGMSKVGTERLSETYAPMVKQGLTRSYKAEAGSVHLAVIRNGQNTDEWMQTTVQTIVSPTMNSAALSRGQMIKSQSYFSLFSIGVFTQWAPAGKFDKKLAATIIASTRPNPQYGEALGQFLLNMNAIAQKGVMDRQKIWHDAQQQISATLTQSYQRNQAIQDRAAEQFSQTIRGVETYVNPSTGAKVELTQGYENAWVNNRGEYVLTEGGFNPAIAWREDWTQLKKGQ